MAFFWKPYVPVAKRREKAKKEMEKLRKKGRAIQPVLLEGRAIARSFWGKGWCDHLESFSDFDNRLPRGRTYVRNGSVCHLEIMAGRIEAIVSGSELYKITIEIAPLEKNVFEKVKQKCRGHIGSILELLQGRLSDHVMAVVCDREHGLFPQPGEIRLGCSCPDWAVMCKHVAAALYGVGSRLDERPDLLFVLRGVDAEELIAAQVILPGAKAATDDALGESDLGKLFGIELDKEAAPSGMVAVEAPESPGKRTRASKSTKAHKKGASKPGAKTRAQAEGRAAPKRKPALAFDPAAPTGADIARLRIHARLTQAQFAQALGVSQSCVPRWESAPGLLRINARSLAALAAFQAKHGGSKPSAHKRKK
jgi:uncharacterized Zn finger protein